MASEADSYAPSRYSFTSTVCSSCIARAHVWIASFHCRIWSHKPSPMGRCSCSSDLPWRIGSCEMVGILTEDEPFSIPVSSPRCQELSSTRGDGPAVEQSVWASAPAGKRFAECPAVKDWRVAGGNAADPARSSGESGRVHAVDSGGPTRRIESRRASKESCAEVLRLRMNWRLYQNSRCTCGQRKAVLPPVLSKSPLPRLRDSVA